jgi:hypothetical protein
MSQENVELALRAYDAFNRRDWAAFVALIDDDVEIVTRIAVIEGGRHGHDGMRGWWENMLTAFPDYDTEVVDVRDLGDVTTANARPGARTGDKRGVSCQLGRSRCTYSKTSSGVGSRPRCARTSARVSAWMRASLLTDHMNAAANAAHAAA